MYGRSPTTHMLATVSDRRKFSMSIRSWRLAEDLCDDCQPLLAKKQDRGSGTNYAPRYKLEHDIEQFE